MLMAPAVLFSGMVLLPLPVSKIGKFLTQSLRRYLNDTQEIDMEFLSAQINSTVSPVNLVLHSPLTEAQGGDAKGTPTYKIIPLPFDSAEGIHEYRFGKLRRLAL